MQERKNRFCLTARCGILLVYGMPGGCLGRFTEGGPFVYMKNERCRSWCPGHKETIGR